MNLLSVDKRWQGKTALVIAPGPSLDAETAAVCSAYAGPKLVVQDAFKAVRNADVLYGCDSKWWAFRLQDASGLADYPAELWTTHDETKNDKTYLVQALPRLHVVQGAVARGFSHDPAVIHYGENSGFQAINLAILFGAAKICLVGFNMQTVDGMQHFFGDHHHGLVNTSDRGYTLFLQAMDAARATVPAGCEIVNCTLRSRIMCFRRSTLEKELYA